MIRLLLLILVLSISSSLYAQSNLKTVSTRALPTKSAQTETMKFGLDGRFWKKLNEPEDILQKMAIVRGIYDGLMFGRSPIMDSYYTKTSLTHLVKALDQFYEDYRNEKILVVWALRVISMELRGESKDAVDTELRRLRKLAS